MTGGAADAREAHDVEAPSGDIHPSWFGLGSGADTGGIGGALGDLELHWLDGWCRSGLHPCTAIGVSGTWPFTMLRALRRAL